MGPVGILALQGGYQRHGNILDRLGVNWRFVRGTGDLSACSGLILPGGESTAISRLLVAYDLLEELRIFSRTYPVMGTCAGLILMGNSCDSRVASLALLDMQVERNAYGRQAQSLSTTIHVDFGRVEKDAVQAIFIRAPRITHVGHSVNVHAWYQGAPVLVMQGQHMGMTFHPELTEDVRIHRYWLEYAGIIGRDRGCGLCA